MVHINNQEVAEGFKGLITLGKVDRLYVGGQEGEVYELYGTVFRVDEDVVVMVPSENTTLPSGSIEQYLHTSILKRSRLVEELHRLTQVREDIQAKKYNYGISERLLATLDYVTTNSIRQLPMTLLGGQLDYEALCKNSAGSDTFREDWEAWSHVEKGRAKYMTSQRQDIGGASGVTRASEFSTSGDVGAINSDIGESINVAPYPGAPS